MASFRMWRSANGCCRHHTLYVTGSLDQVTGRYTFQGRRFDLDPTSSINFHADLNPELYLVVTDTSGQILALSEAERRPLRGYHHAFRSWATPRGGP